MGSSKLRLWPGKTVSRCIFQLFGPQSGEKKLLWTPLKDWHGGFQTWSMEAAAFHRTAADWTDVHLERTHQWNELLQWERWTLRSSTNRGCKRRVDTHQQIFERTAEQHGTEWADLGNLRIFTSNGSSHLDLEKRGGQLISSTSIGYVSIMSEKQWRQDKLTDIQTATQVNPQVVQKCTYCWTIKGLWDFFENGRSHVLGVFIFWPFNTLCI